MITIELCPICKGKCRVKEYYQEYEGTELSYNFVVRCSNKNKECKIFSMIKNRGSYRTKYKAIRAWNKACKYYTKFFNESSRLIKKG